VGKPTTDCAEDWIRTNDHKVTKMNPETEDITGNITTGLCLAKTLLFSTKGLGSNSGFVCPRKRTIEIFQ
jgi:hypothetical protein